MTSSPHRAPAGGDSDLLHLRRTFVHHLAADGRSRTTRTAYIMAIAQLEAFLSHQHPPASVTDVQPNHLGAFSSFSL